MKPIRFKVVKSRSTRNLPSLRILDLHGDPQEFVLQEELKKAGAQIGDIVVLQLASPRLVMHCDNGLQCIQHKFSKSLSSCICLCGGCRP